MTLALPFSHDQTVPQRFESVAQTHATRPAVCDPHHRWTYHDLRQRMLATAGLIAAQLPPGRPRGVVAILLPAGAPHIAAVLGVLHVGGIYLSLDPTYPEAHLRAKLAAADACAVITTPELAPRVLAWGHRPLTLAETPLPATPPPASDPSPESFACLYFTSGSTGEPKAVVHTHRNILFDIARQTRDLGVTPEDRFDLLFSPSFSAFLSPVFGALLTGASVHLFDLKTHPVADLRTWISREQISISTMSVSTFRRLMAAPGIDPGYPALRLLSLGAEPLSLADLALFKRRFPPACLLQNALATTETRTIAQLLLPASAPLPTEISVGHPVGGKALVLVDDQGRPVPPGEPGEIVVESEFISPGHWHDLRHLPGHRLPAPRVSLHPTGDLGRFLPDGRLLHLGRKDHQIKLNGHRIEAGEIETAFLAHPAVANAAVFLLPSHATRPDRLVALLLLVEPTPPDIAFTDWRKYLAATLPSWMLPDVVVPVAALPLTPTGKLDRRRLAVFFAEHVPAPAQSLLSDETACADDPLFAAWKKILARPDLRPADDFFAVGGDSLSAVELMAEIALISGRRPPLGLLVEAPTFIAFRARLSVEEPLPPVVRSLPLNPGEGCLPTYLLPPWNHSGIVFRDFGSLPATGGPLVALEAFDPLPDGQPAASIESIAALYAAFLRARHPEGRFALAGFSMGGHLAWETARQLDALGSAPVHLFLLDATRFHTVLPPDERARLARQTSIVGRTVNLARYLLRPGSLDRRMLLKRAFDGPLRRLRLAPPRPPRPADAFAAEFVGNIPLYRRYTVSAYAGPVTLVRVAEQAEWENVFHWDLGWSRHCLGRFDIVAVPGRHLELNRHPAVARLQHLFQKTLSAETNPRGRAT